ncbi:S41 family peptidase [Paraglaciecola sp.]|uniref:S41 family peptidase n=1 Tax=Paraglaciecola sp. TaxID=1920173 RepID=UPI0030F4447B
MDLIVLKHIPLRLILFFCVSTTVFAQPQRVTNLVSFAKTYGYVRYFYPSDEASAINWEQFLVYGSQIAEQAKNDKELIIVLADLFKPLAPQIVFNLDGSVPQIIPPAMNKGDLMPVYWQHLGLGGKNSNVYKSKRVGRTFAQKKGAENRGNFMQSFPVKNYLDRTFRLKALTKVSSGSNAQLWARVDLPDGKSGFFDNMSDRPIQNTGWMEVVLQGRIDATAEQLVFGLMLNGSNQAYVDYIRLEVQADDGTWQKVEVNNSEMDDWSEDTLDHWFVAKGTYKPQKAQDVCDACNAVYLGPEYSLMSQGQTLFSTSPKKEEVFSSQISEQIHLHMPLVVLGDEHHTYPIATHRAKILLNKIQDVQLNFKDKYTQISDVIVLWNSIQHFYPYFDQIDDTWSNVLVNSLDAIEQELNEGQFEERLKLMVVAFQDGHGRLYNPRKNDLMLPVLFDLVEEQIVVTKSLTPDLEIGDVVVKIAGKEVNSLFKHKMSLVSGSPQWKRAQALIHLRMWQSGIKVEIVFQRNAKQHSTSVQPGKHYLLKDDVLSPITSLKNDIYYVDLDRASMQEIAPIIQNIANAKGVIFDLRGYPKNNHKVISHLLSKPDTSDKWMKVPHIIYPDHKFTEWENYNWLLPVAKPHIKSKVVFLTNAKAISYSESVLSFIKHYKLATIVGEATAGANGNINHIALPSGLGVVFTGMRVSKHDGTQHHLIGVKPDVEITRTLQAVKDGRDEYLEKALEIIEGSL